MVTKKTIVKSLFLLVQRRADETAAVSPSSEGYAQKTSATCCSTQIMLTTMLKSRADLFSAEDDTAISLSMNTSDNANDILLWSNHDKDGDAILIFSTSADDEGAKSLCNNGFGETVSPCSTATKDTDTAPFSFGGVDSDDDTLLCSNRDDDSCATLPFSTGANDEGAEPICNDGASDAALPGGYGDVILIDTGYRFVILISCRK